MRAGLIVLIEDLHPFQPRIPSLPPPRQRPGGRHQTRHESSPSGSFIRAMATPVRDGTSHWVRWRQGIGRTLSSSPPPPPVLSAEDKFTRFPQIYSGFITPRSSRGVNHSRPLRSTSAPELSPVPSSITVIQPSRPPFSFPTADPGRCACDQTQPHTPLKTSPALWRADTQLNVEKPRLLIPYNCHGSVG